MFVRSGKEGSQVAPLTKHLSVRRRARTTCFRLKEVVVEEIERVPAASAPVARPECQRWAWCASTGRGRCRRSVNTSRVGASCERVATD